MESEPSKNRFFILLPKCLGHVIPSPSQGRTRQPLPLPARLPLRPRLHELPERIIVVVATQHLVQGQGASTQRRIAQAGSSPPWRAHGSFENCNPVAYTGPKDVQFCLVKKSKRLFLFGLAS